MYCIYPARDSYNGEILWIWYGTNGLSCRTDGLFDLQGSAPWIITYLLGKLLHYCCTLIGIRILRKEEKREKSGNLSDVGKQWTEKCFRLAFYLVLKREHLRYYFRRQELKCIPEHKKVISTEQSVRNGMQKCVLSVLALCRVALCSCWWATNGPKWE